MSSYLFTSSADAVHFLVVAATILMATTPIALTCPPLPPSSRYRDNALAATLLPEGSTLTVGMCRLSTGQCLDPLAQFTPEQGRGEEEVRYARPLQNVHLSTFTFCARKRGRKRRTEEKKKKKETNKKKKKKNKKKKKKKPKKKKKKKNKKRRKKKEDK